MKEADLEIVHNAKTEELPECLLKIAKDVNKKLSVLSADKVEIMYISNTYLHYKISLKDGLVLSVTLNKSYEDIGVVFSLQENNETFYKNIALLDDMIEAVNMFINARKK